MDLDVSEPMRDFKSLVPKPSVHGARKMSHLIARDLRGLIIRGELAPEQALPSETDLLQTFQVSRNTLREALRILESESLIQIRRGRAGGAVVQHPLLSSVVRYVSLLFQVRGATVGDLQEARVLIEAPAAARLAGTSPDNIRRLREIHQAELAELDDPLGFLSALSTFERAVFDISGNKTIEVLSSIFRDIVNAEASIRGSLPRQSQVRTKLAALQDEFIDTIADGDHRQATASWSEYLKQTAKLLSRDARSEPLDVVPVWRAEISSDGTGPQSSKMAASIATEIRIEIATGKIGEGDLLPPMPELVNRFGVSRPTMREALRILEMEGLVDLRTGSRNGARVFEPTTEKAAHLAGVVLESAQTRMGDVAEAQRLIEPAVMGLAATRIDQRTLSTLSECVQVLKGTVDDTPAFVKYFEDLERQAFSAVRNPAISVGIEVIMWVADRCRTALTVSALSLPQVTGSNRRTCRSFEGFIEAAKRSDGEAAAEIWAKHLDEVSPFFRSPMGDRLIVDLFD